jgi:uncharacterized membrane protein
MRNMDDAKYTEEDIQKNKDLAALSYMWLFSVVVILARRDSPFIRLHAGQAVVLFVLSLVLWPLGVFRYGEFLVLALMVLGFMEAVMGNAYRIPVISLISEGRLRVHHFKKAWHIVKHTAIKIAKPEHITPEFRERLKEDARESGREMEFLKTEQRLEDREDKKLSALIRRVEDEEKELHKLEDDLHRVENKVDEVLKNRE